MRIAAPLFLTAVLLSGVASAQQPQPLPAPQAQQPRPGTMLIPQVDWRPNVTYREVQIQPPQPQQYGYLMPAVQISVGRPMLFPRLHGYRPMLWGRGVSVCVGGRCY